MPVFGWRAAVGSILLPTVVVVMLIIFEQLKHQSRNHYHHSVEWIKLSEDQTASARQSDSRQVDSGQQLRRDDFSCTHCLDRPSEQKPATLAIVKQHLLTKYVMFQLALLSQGS